MQACTSVPFSPTHRERILERNESTSFRTNCVVNSLCDVGNTFCIQTVHERFDYVQLVFDAEVDEICV